MKTKLIKLTEEHYVIVDDSEINSKDYILLISDSLIGKINDIVKVVSSKEYRTDFIKADGKEHWIACDVNYNRESRGKKITHSFGKELDGVINKPLSEIEELLYGYSVEKMASDFSTYEINNGCENYHDLQYGYACGIRAHQELVKDKHILTKEQLRFLYDTAIHSTIGNLSHEDEFNKVLAFLTKPKTEWDIEIDEQGKISLL
jgi:hypothetical protein